MKTIKFKIIFIILFLPKIYLNGQSITIKDQLAINSSGVPAAPSAILDMVSTTKGLLIPRMSTMNRNALTALNGMMIYNTQVDLFEYYDGNLWHSLAVKENIPWNITGTSIYNNNAGNVGIGIANPTQAKLVVNGDVNGQVALFKSVSGVSIDGSSIPNVGFNIDNGKAISDGAGSILSFNPAVNSGSSGTLNLDFFKTKPAGGLFTAPLNILKFQDFTAFGLGYWLDLNKLPNSRINISDRMHSESNGNLNLLPIGVINFKVTGLGNGDNATKIVHNVGNSNGLYQNIYYFNVDTGSGIGSGYMNLILNLDFITKDYNDIYIVGSPNFYNSGEETQACYSKFYRNPVGTQDRIQIWFGSSYLSNSTEVFGTLMVYGTKN